MAPGFKDHFSGHAADYAAYRPVYPQALVDFLADVTPGRRLAWDCGCGSGQLAVQLATAFERVVATDASAQQIRNATPHPRVSYACAAAEASTLPTGAVDLVVAAQAAHWFDLPAFYAEVRRVAVRGGVVALVSYGVAELDQPLAAIVGRFYREVLDPYWPPERRHVEDGYRSLPFPFPEIATPALAMTRRWRLPDLLGYVGTWSATRAAGRAQGGGLFRRFADELAAAWGDPEMPRDVRWPLGLRVGFARSATG